MEGKIFISSGFGFNGWRNASKTEWNTMSSSAELTHRLGARRPMLQEVTSRLWWWWWGGSNHLRLKQKAVVSHRSSFTDLWNILSQVSVSAEAPCFKLRLRWGMVTPIWWIFWPRIREVGKKKQKRNAVSAVQYTGREKMVNENIMSALHSQQSVVRHLYYYSDARGRWRRRCTLRW